MTEQTDFIKPETLHTLDELQSKIHYHFNDLNTLLQALTHTSYGHEHFSKKSNSHRDNERLEFLGDAILDGIISDLLYETFQNIDEGQLSKLRASAVNEKILTEIAKKINLHECVRLGKGELQTGGKDKPSILSSTFEALIAAIYLDGGFESAYKVIKDLFLPLFIEEGISRSSYDFKTELQEKMQALTKITPTYSLVTTTGPDHAKIFTVEVRATDFVLATSTGASKKEAEQNAAKNALENENSFKINPLTNLTTLLNQRPKTL